MRRRTAEGDVFTELVLEVFRLHGLLLAAGDRMAEPSGLTSARWQVLGVVDHAPAPVAHVARIMGLTRQTVQTTADALERDGFVEYRENPHHRRARLIAPTDEGREALRRVEARQATWADRIGRGVGQEALRTAVDGLRRARQRLEEDAPDSLESLGGTMSDEMAIPVFPCASPDETLDFYQALGFEVTHRQVKPYVWLAVNRGGFHLHFYGGGKPDPEGGSATCLVMVDAIEPYHRAFAEALKGKLGRVPTAGLPRITRLRKGQGRFTLVDPTGNSIVFIVRNEPEYEYPDKESWSKLSPMERALETAANFRDMRGKDASAAKTLDLALKKNPDAAPVERARVLAARAELAVAMGDAERARSARTELASITLGDEERERYRDELQAVDAIERMQG